MSDENRGAEGRSSDAISERVRRIRFRMSREHSRFVDEIRLIPAKLVIAVICLYLVAEALGLTVLIAEEGLPWPQLSYRLNLLALAGVITAVSIPFACLIFLIGYVYRDAKRRGMNAVLWTVIIIILLPAWLAIGFILYFLLREPMPYSCPQCRATVSARFNYCPSCKFNLRPSCPSCRREVRLEDRFCTNCAAELGETRSSLGQPEQDSSADLGAAG